MLIIQLYHITFLSIKCLTALFYSDIPCGLNFLSNTFSVLEYNNTTLLILYVSFVTLLLNSITTGLISLFTNVLNLSKFFYIIIFI